MASSSAGATCMAVWDLSLFFLESLGHALCYLESFVLDQLLHAIYDEQITIVVYVPDVTSMKPPFLIQSPLGFFFVLVVAYQVMHSVRMITSTCHSGEEYLPFMTHWLLTQTSPGVFLGRDRPVSGSTNLTSMLGRMKPTEFFLAMPWPFLGSPWVSVMQLCSVSPYA